MKIIGKESVYYEGVFTNCCYALRVSGHHRTYPSAILSTLDLLVLLAHI